MPEGHHTRCDKMSREPVALIVRQQQDPALGGERVPLMVTDAPTKPELGDKLVIVGVVLPPPVANLNAVIHATDEPPLDVPVKA